MVHTNECFFYLFLGFTFASVNIDCARFSEDLVILMTRPFQLSVRLLEETVITHNDYILRQHSLIIFISGHLRKKLFLIVFICGNF